MRNENLEAKMHRSLTKPMTWGGLPRNVFLMFVLMSILIFIVLPLSLMVLSGLAVNMPQQKIHNFLIFSGITLKTIKGCIKQNKLREEFVLYGTT